MRLLLRTVALGTAALVGAAALARAATLMRAAALVRPAALGAAAPANGATTGSDALFQSFQLEVQMLRALAFLFTEFCFCCFVYSALHPQCLRVPVMK